MLAEQQGLQLEASASYDSIASALVNVQSLYSDFHLKFVHYLGVFAAFCRVIAL